MYDYDEENAAPWADYKEDIQYIIVLEGVARIGSYAFYGCSGVESVCIPETVTQIGDYAFANCVNLKELDLSDGLEAIEQGAFYDCESLYSINNFPDGLTSIGSYAFYGCAALEGISFPDSLTSIGAYAFYRCENLKLVHIYDNIETLGGAELSQVFDSNVIIIGVEGSIAEEYANENGNTFYAITSADTSIKSSGTCGAEEDEDNIVWELYNTNTLYLYGDGTMEDYNLNTKNVSNAPWAGHSSEIKKIVFYGTISNIGSYAFYGHTALTGTLTIPDSVTSIGSYAFYGSTGFEKIALGSGITDIGEYSFYGCTKLAGMAAIPDSAASIGSYAFYGCTGLEGITFGSGITDIGEYAFCGCTSLASELALPDSVTGIGAYAFYQCSKLAGLTLSENLSEIPDHAFDGCESITGQLTIPDQVTGIGSYAFRDCTGITGLSTGADLYTIGDYAFYNCSGLKGELVIPMHATTIGDYAFDYCTSLSGNVYINETVTSIGYCTVQFSAYRTIYGVKDSCAETYADNSIYITFVEYDFDQCPISGGTFITEDDNNDDTSDDNNNDDTSDDNDGTSDDGNDTGKGTSDDHDGIALSGTDGAVSYTVYDDGLLWITGSGAMKDYLLNGNDRSTAPWSAYAGTITKIKIDEGITKIGNYAFYGLYNVSELCELPGTLTDIGSEAFGQCMEMQGSLTIPASVKTIEAYAFDTCLALTELIFAENSQLEGIGEGAFICCGRLNGTLNIPDSVTVIGDAAFWYCSGIEQLYIGNHVESIGVQAFSYMLSLTGDIEIPASVKTIGAYAFEASSMKGVQFQSGLEEIEEYAFANCPNLKGSSGNSSSIVFPDTLKTIGKGAFYNCTSIGGDSYIPNSVTGIGEIAFGENGAFLYAEKGSYAEEYAALYSNYIFVALGEEDDIPSRTESSSGSSSVSDDYYGADRMNLSSVSGEVAGIKSKVYDGSAYEPTVKVTVKDPETEKKVTLTEGVDYGVEYLNNKNAGTGYAIVTGKNSYSGTLIKEFTITPKAIKKCKAVSGAMTTEMTDPPIYLYDGAYDLTSEDYSAAYTGSLTAGGTVTCTVTGLGNYTGSMKVKVQVYDAETVVLNDENVTLEYETAFYTGKALKPVVLYKGSVMDKKDYKATYANNKAAGTAYVTITGKNGYVGKVVKTFQIEPLEPEVTITVKDVTYNGKLQKPAVTVVNNATGKKLSKNKDYTVAYAYNLHAETKDAEEYAPTVIITGKGNYDGLSATQTFQINAQNIKKASVKGNYEEFWLKYGKNELVEGVDYEIEDWEENDAGTKATVTFVGIGDYTGSKEKKFSIPREDD